MCLFKIAEASVLRPHAVNSMEWLVFIPIVFIPTTCNNMENDKYLESLLLTHATETQSFNHFAFDF